MELRVQDELGSAREQTVTISVIHGNFIPVIQKMLVKVLRYWKR